ncbi:MAG: pre-toxin TG domain-containing protein [Bdellovibrionia bacterium]
MKNKLIAISWLAISLFGFVTKASANSCPNHEACFELRNNTTGNCHPTVWLNGTEKIGNDFLPVSIGDKSITTILRGFDKYWLTASVGITPSHMFQEGQNLISLTWDNRCNLADSSASIALNYYAVGKSTPKQICFNATKFGKTTIQCSHQSVDLKALDEDLYRQIDALKIGINNFDYSAEIHRKNVEKYRIEIPALEKSLADLNGALKGINLDDFLGIRTEELAAFIKEDPRIKERFEGLKKTVETLKLEVDTELAKNQREIQETMAALTKSFSQTNQEVLQYNFNFTPHLVEINPSQFDLESPELIVDPAYAEIADAAIESLQRALDLGRGAEFTSEFSTWEKQQAKILSALNSSGVSVVDRKRFQLEQKKVIDFVKQHVDTYGFFADSKVDTGRRRIIATKIKDIDGKAGQDLADELNQWKSDFNENQKRVLEDLSLFEPVFDQLKKAKSGNSDPQKIQAASIAEIAVKDALESLVDAARNARDPSSEEEFKEDISEAEVAMKVARQLLDFCVGLTPIGTVSDFISAGTGVNVVTGEILDEMGQTFTFVGGVIGIVPGGALVKGPIKALGRIVSKFSQSIVSAGKKVTGVALARTIAMAERIFDSAEKIVKHSPIHEGILHSKPISKGILSLDVRGVPIPHARISDTFRSGTYLTLKTKQPTKLYRVFSAPDEFGHRSSFWTRNKPSSSTQSMIDSALESSWGNQATKWIEIEVPIGKTLHEGVAASIQRVGNNMSEFIGGGNQVYLDFEVPLEWIINRGKF